MLKFYTHAISCRLDVKVLFSRNDLFHSMLAIFDDGICNLQGADHKTCASSSGLSILCWKLTSRAVNNQVKTRRQLLAVIQQGVS